MNVKPIKTFLIYRILLYIFHQVRKFSVVFLNADRKFQYLKNYHLFNLSNAEHAALKRLKKDGFVMLDGVFTNAQIDEIYSKVKVCLSNAESISEEQKNDFNHEDKLRLKDPILQIPELASLVFNDVILKIGSKYKGFIPAMVVNCYKTLPYVHSKTPKGSSNYHRDDLGDMSVFVYLHDVDESSGAVSYVKNSHGYHVRSFLPISNYEKGLIHDANLAYSDAEVKKYYPPDSFVRASGARGTVLFIDVTGIHKGPIWEPNDPSNKDRTVLHIVLRQKNLFKTGFTPKITSSNSYTEGLSDLGKLVVDAQKK